MQGPALLFCPADRPDRFAKAAAAADSVILDLEDAVAPESKAGARAALQATLLDPARTIVRVNPVATSAFALDLSALHRTPYRTIMLAKTESPDDVRALHGFQVLALCETARGVEMAGRIAETDGVVALMWGAEDLVASIGGRSSRSPGGGYRDIARYARERVLIAAAAAGRSAIDSVHLDIADLSGLRREVEDAAAIGFDATACIHPTQVAVIRAGYAPDEIQIDWARRVLEAAASRPGVFRFEGRMVDEPVLRQARATLLGIRQHNPTGAES